MTDEREKAGLGEVVYSVDDGDRAETKQERQEKREEEAQVETADEESFPASDPPGFSGAKLQESS
jgi:hypothetical protein